MIKITELTEIKTRPHFVKDANGNRIKIYKDVLVRLSINCIKHGPRFVHFTIDFFIISLLTSFFNTCLLLLVENYTFGNNSLIIINFITNILILIIFPSFYILFEYYWGKTPGKFITKSLVINELGVKPDLKTIILRTFARFVPFELFSCYGGNYSYGWHDKWSETWVV